MTIKRPKGNLKRLFIFNALLLVVAFTAIQYAVVENMDISAQPTVLELDRDYVVQGLLKQQLKLFDAPTDIPNIKFKNIFDSDMSLDDLKGQWIILNIWASWCPPCIKEMPSLQAVQDAYGGQGIKVIGISVDRDMEGDKLRKVMRHYNFGPIAAYYGEWMDIKPVLGIKGLPTTYILSPNGQAIGMVEGDIDWISDDTNAFIESLIK